MGSREAPPHKGRTAVSWSRQGCRGLYLHNGAFPTAATDLLRHKGTGYGLPPRSTNSGPVRRGDSKKTITQGTSALEGIQLGGQRDSGRRRHRGYKPLHRGRLGTGGSCIGQEFKQRGAPDRSAHYFRASPDPGESWSTAIGSGRRHRQVLAGAA